MSVREKQSIIGTLNADKKQSIVGNIDIADVLIREGEYYVPNVSQVDEDTIVLSLTPSKDFMETVSDQEITLPRGRDGRDGSDYVLTNEDKSEIAEQAVSLIDITDVIRAPSTANPGQVLVVKSVDSNNKPTEWEVTDAPTGIGGGSGIVVSDTEPDDTSVLWIDTDDNEADNLQATINTALAQAKASGDFKGDPGEPGKTPEKGKDYFTEADKTEIAELAAEMVEVPEGGAVTDEQIASVVADCIEQASVTNNEVIDLLVENDMLPGITDADGSILTDENNNILLW